MRVASRARAAARLPMLLLLPPRLSSGWPGRRCCGWDCFRLYMLAAPAAAAAAGGPCWHPTRLAGRWASEAQMLHEVEFLYALCAWTWFLPPSLPPSVCRLSCLLGPVHVRAGSFSTRACPRVPGQHARHGTCALCVWTSMDPGAAALPTVVRAPSL
eukprot:jgi/Mesen1/4021/ME000212S03062